MCTYPDFDQVYIAQREFVQAVDLVLRASAFCQAKADKKAAQAAALDLEVRTQHLIDVLANELSTQKSFQGGPRAARNAVQLLCRLERSSQAPDLFLQHREAILQASLKYDGLLFALTHFYYHFCSSSSSQEREN